MTLPGTDKPEMERRHALAWSLTTVGGALFLLGFLRLITGYAGAVYPHFVCTGMDASTDPTPALLSLRLAGWFAVSGWVIPYLPLLRDGGRRICSALGAWSAKGNADGLLEILLCGLFFIVLVLTGMVSLWSPTIR